MKKYIREMIDDIHGRKQKDFIPAVPAPAKGAKTTYLDPPPAPALPGDLENQILSDNSAERVRQLAFQAQQKEEGKLGG